MLNLATFKLQMPTFQAGQSEQTVIQPTLATFSDPTYFYTNSAGAVAFVTNAGGATTQGSQYPRCELAEVLYTGRGGEHAAAWSIAAAAVHTMTFTGATIRLTPVRPIVVIAQIKGATDVPLQIRVTGSAKGNIIQAAIFNRVVFTLDPKYVLGTKYTIQIVAGQNKIQVYYNGALMVNLANTAETADPSVGFKVGNYLQSNTATYGEAATATSEVWVYSLQVSQA